MAVFKLNMNWQLSSFLLSKILAAFFISFFFTVPACGQVDEELLRRFKEDAPIAWAECDLGRRELASNEKYWHIEQEDFRKSNSDSNELMPTVAVVYKRLGIGQKNIFNRRINYEGGYDKIEAKNPSYTFELQRSSKENPWQLIGLNRRDVDDNASEEQKSDSNQIITTHVSADGFPRWGRVPTPSWMELPNLHFERVAYVEYEGKSCVEIKMMFTEPNRMFYTGKTGEPVDRKLLKSAAATHVCTAIFSPKDYWLLMRLDGYMTGNPRDKNEREEYLVERKYEFILHGIPYLTLDQLFYGNSRYSEMPSNKTIYSYGKKPSLDEFRVSTYGFPEPDWYRPPFNWNRLLLILALTIIGISLTVAVVKLLIKRK